MLVIDEKEFPDFEFFEFQNRRIFGGEPGGPPYLYLAIKQISTGKLYEVNLGCVGFDFEPGCTALKQKILDKIEEVIRECNG